MELIVEQVSGARKMIQSQKLSGEKITIGRAYDNDVVLTDPYVCAHHLELLAGDDGVWQVRDRDSLNGSFDDNGEQLRDYQTIDSGDVVAIGKSHIRFLYPNHPVAPTIRLSGIEGLLNLISSPMVVMMVFIAYIGLLFGDHYLQTVTELKTSSVVKSIFSLLVLSSIWPMLCSLLARLFKNDARILTQMALCYSFFILFLLFGWLEDFISFNSSNSYFVPGFSYAAEAALLFSLLWANFYVAFHQDVRRRTIMAGGFTISLLLLSFLYNHASRRDFNPSPDYDSTLMAPEFMVVEPVSINEFITSSESIFERTARQASKKKE